MELVVDLDKEDHGTSLQYLSPSYFTRLFWGGNERRSFYTGVLIAA